MDKNVNFGVLVDVIVETVSREWTSSNGVHFHVSDNGGFATRQGVKVGNWFFDNHGMAAEAETSLTAEEIAEIREEVEKLAE